MEIFNAARPLGKPTEQATFPGSSIVELFVVPSAAHRSRALWQLYKDGTLAEECRDSRCSRSSCTTRGSSIPLPSAVNLSDLKGLRLRSPNRTVSAALEDRRHRDDLG